jgi:hypothetical protein
MLAPEPGSRRLYAGCRLGSKQVPSQAGPEAEELLGFDIGIYASRRVISGSLSFVFPIRT